MEANRFLEIFERNHNALPGLQAQLLLAPPYRKTLVEQFKKEQPQPKQAAVLLCVYPSSSGILHFALIRRNEYPGVHSGQIGFPGGRVEASDTSHWNAALREAEEEIGVQSSQITQLLPLSSLYIPPSNFMVRPFVGWSSSTPNFKADPKEVAEIIEVPLVSFLGAKPQNSATLFKSEKAQKAVIPYYPLFGANVWGATAMILSEFQQFMKQQMAI